MKCSDIPDGPILKFLAGHQGEWCTWGAGYSMATVSVAMPTDVPPKLQLAKMKRLIARGLVRGCPCGCRGDWEITDAGLALVETPRVVGMLG